MAHVGIATAFAAPRLQLDDTEGEKLASAVQKVMRHYDVPDIASETKDWIGLIICMGTIYGTRYAAWQFDKNTAPPPPPSQQQDNNVTALTRPVGAMNHPGPIS